MKTLIAYATKYGTTRTCAERIGEGLPGEVQLLDMRRDRTPRLDSFDAVVIGGPIYAGKVMPAVPQFCERNREALLERTVGLFICCLYEGETARQELDEAFPPWLKAHAVIRSAPGGAIAYSRLGIVDRYLAKRVARVTRDIRTVKDEELATIAAAVASAVQAI